MRIRNVMSTIIIIQLVFSQIANSQCTHPDYDALVSLYVSTNGTEWLKSGTQSFHTSTEKGWLKDCEVCDWYGVVCNSEDRVIELILPDNNLTGNLPPEIGDLFYLRGLKLQQNSIEGSIPNTISALSNIVIFNLSFNQLSGTIPPEIHNLSNLQQIILSQNNLTGNIPSNIDDLPSLSVLVLSHNQLTGSIPSEIADISSLNIFSVANNELTGSIPSGIGSLSGLSTIFLNENNLQGCIPEDLRQKCFLIDMSFDNNPLLPWGGDTDSYCFSSGSSTSQIGTPCDDGIVSNGNDVISDNCGCGDIPLSTYQIYSQQKIYPNPVSDRLHINTNQPYPYQLLDITGRMILSGIYREEIDVSELQSGSYFLKVWDERGEFLMVEKVIIY